LNDATLVILVHQLVFQGMFLAKNIALRRKLGTSISGRNREARRAIAFFVFFIALSLGTGLVDDRFGSVAVLTERAALIVGLALLGATIILGAASLSGMRDSWRVGVQENQRTELIEKGIYRFSRNPYFLSYLIMFAAYSILFQNAILLGLSVVGFVLIHSMVLTEERHLAAVHGDAYHRYRERVPRYLIV